VVAPGLIERPYVFEGNDLPGVMISTGVRRLINLYAVRPGQRAVVFSANPERDAAAVDLRRPASMSPPLWMRASAVG
jgi:sarcosine oxidase subunit alpha